MAKKKKGRKKGLLAVDFQFGMHQTIPCSQRVIPGKPKHPQNVRKVEFNKIVKTQLKEEFASQSQFPTKNEIFIFIIQYFLSQKNYQSTDVDNMAKTILDTLEGQFFFDDSQVKALLICKKIDKTKVPQNFAYIAVKELIGDRDINILKIAGIERSVIYYQELKKKLPAV